MKPSSTKTVRVILADDHPILRAGIRDVLKQMPYVELVGEARDGREAIELVEAVRPHLVLIGISMPGLNGLEATAHITKAFPKVRVIIVSRHANLEYYRHALRAGASGYLLKRAVIDELESALRRVVAGEVYLSRDILARLRRKVPLDGIDEVNELNRSAEPPEAPRCRPL